MTDPIGPVRAALAGRYEIERKIGEGAFAAVYLAQDLRHDRLVAIKVLSADPTSDNSELRFLAEIRLLAKLQHPNIVPLIDSGHAGATLYYVMPYVNGESLRERIDRERQLPLDAAVAIAREAADALAYAHEQGIIHRDIKPENVLLSARTQELLWRGQGVATVSADPAAYSKELAQSVSAVLKKFPQTAA